MPYTATDDEDDTADRGPDFVGDRRGCIQPHCTKVLLTFKAVPNFEAPKDAGKDNVYNITVVATDSDDQTDEMDVTVTVTNVDETGR